MTEWTEVSLETVSDLGRQSKKSRRHFLIVMPLSSSFSRPKGALNATNKPWNCKTRENHYPYSKSDLATTLKLLSLLRPVWIFLIPSLAILLPLSNTQLVSHVWPLNDVVTYAKRSISSHAYYHSFPVFSSFFTAPRASLRVTLPFDFDSCDESGNHRPSIQTLNFSFDLTLTLYFGEIWEVAIDSIFKNSTITHRILLGMMKLRRCNHGFRVFTNLWQRFGTWQ